METRRKKKSRKYTNTITEICTHRIFPRVLVVLESFVGGKSANSPSLDIWISSLLQLTSPPFLIPPPLGLATMAHHTIPCTALTS